MRKILIITTFCFVFICNNTFAMTTNEYITYLEEKLFGANFSNQTISERIDRIEMQIYDNNYAGSTEERLAKIEKIYPKEELETQSPNSQNYYEENWYKQNYPEEETSNYNNYPIINQIEEKIYKRNYQGEDIYSRLARLEQELYGNIKNDQTLQDRVESLKSVLPNKHYNRFSAQNVGLDDFGLNTPSEYQKTSNVYFDKQSIVEELELETFNKSFEREHLSKRLDRLENYYFGNISMNSNDSDRINRLATVIMNKNGMNNYPRMPKGAQWAGILMNLLMIGLGFLL